MEAFQVFQAFPIAENDFEDIYALPSALIAANDRQVDGSKSKILSILSRITLKYLSNSNSFNVKNEESLMSIVNNFIIFPIYWNLQPDSTINMD